MAECMKNGVTCPDFYKCTDEGDVVESIGKNLSASAFTAWPRRA